MRLLVLIAGTNDPSNAATLAQAFAEGMKTVEEAEISTMKLNDLKLRHFTLELYDPQCIPEDDFCTLQDAIIAADGVVIATPIWNFSVPAHLKNVIDRMGAFALDLDTRSKGQFKGKPFYFIFTGGAPLVAWKALMSITTVHLSEAIKYYGGTILGKHFEPKCVPGKGKFGLVVDKRPKTLAHMKKRGAIFATVVRTFSKTHKLPFWCTVKYTVCTWLYRIANRIMYPITEGQ